MERRIGTEARSAALMLMLVTAIACAIFDTPSPAPTFQVDYGDEIVLPTTTTATSSLLAAAEWITLINTSSFEIWRPYSHESFGLSLYVDVNVPLLNATEVRMGLRFTVLSGSANISFETHQYYIGTVNERLLAAPGQHSMELTYEWPYSGDTDYGWIEQQPVSIRIANPSECEVELERFFIEVEISDDVVPMTVDVLRTTGESLFSCPHMHQVSGYSVGPHLDFFNTMDERVATLNPSRANDTMLLPSGNYSVVFYWPNRPIVSLNLTVPAATWTALEMRIPFSRVLMNPSQLIPNLGVTLDYYSLYGEYTDLLVSSKPFVYVPPNSTVSAVVRSFSTNHGPIYSSLGILASLQSIDTGVCRNVTIVIHPNYIQIGCVLIAPLRLISLLLLAGLMSSAAFLYSPILKRSRGFIPCMAVIASLLVPWFTYTSTYSYLSPTPFDIRNTHYYSTPAFGTFLCADGTSVVLVGQTVVHAMGSMLLWTAAFFLFVAVMMRMEEDGNLPRTHGLTAGFVLFAIMEFSYLALCIVLNPAEQVQLGLGPFLSLIALLFWFRPLRTPDERPAS